MSSRNPSISGYSAKDYTGIILEAVALRFFSTKINVFLCRDINSIVFYRHLTWSSKNLHRIKPVHIKMRQNLYYKL